MCADFFFFLPSDQARYLPQRINKTMPVVAVKAQESGRANRVNNRRLATAVEALDTDLLKFNALKSRKKVQKKKKRRTHILY